MKKILIKNIGHLVNCKSHNRALGTLKDAWAALEGPFIQEFGEMIDFPGVPEDQEIAIIDAQRMAVMALHFDGRTCIPKVFEYGRFEHVGIIPVEQIGKTIYEKSDFKQLI